MLLAGCASTYAPSNKMLQFRQGLDKQAAIEILARYTNPSSTDGSYCGGNQYLFDAGTPLAITQGGYTLRVFKLGELVSTEDTGTATRYTYKKVYYDDGRKFSDIIKIRIMPGWPIYGNCQTSNPSGHGVRLYFSTADHDVFGVSKAGLDEMLAALSVLAPRAQFIQGVGL